MFRMLTESASWSDADLSSLRFCMSGGAPMPIPLIQRYREEKGVVFRQGFGMTEFGPGVFSLPAELAISKAGSIGRPNFFVDARIVDPATNVPVATGRIGELVLRGPSAMTGYFENADATAQVFDAEGWLHTGDLARVDEDGCFFIVDRLKDLFISGGEKVYPAEVEAVLHAHPCVSQAAVIGVDDDRWGQVGIAHVVLRNGMTVSADELLEWAASKLAKYKVPQRVIFRDALPTTSVGKLLKRALRTGVANTELEAGDPQ
jgi:fatty-acyl-CoA synthase